MTDTEPSPFPPPPPSAMAGAAAPARSHSILLVLGAIGVVAALVFGLLWASARGAADDAERERDVALSERDIANESAIELNTELQATKDQLATAEQAAADQTTDADAAAAAQAQADELRAEVDRLTEQVAQLTADNEALAADLAAAQAPAETVPETTAPPTTVAPTGTVPTSTRELGRRLVNLYRSSVLGSGQEECLGQSVLDALGADQLTAILESGDAAGDNDELVAALNAAAGPCGVDPSAIFG